MKTKFARSEPYKKTEWLEWPTLDGNVRFIISKYTALGWKLHSTKSLGDGRTEIKFFR